MTGALIQDYSVRRRLRPGEAAKIPELHDRIYSAEYGLDERSRAYVEQSVQVASDRGWPDRAGAVWLVDRDGELAGTLALTLEGKGVGAVHWFVLAPELRGRGLGRTLFGELMVEARAAGLRLLELETFSLLKTAARIYRQAGFRVVSEHQFDGWGPMITIQRYELQLP